MPPLPRAKRSVWLVVAAIGAVVALAAPTVGLGPAPGLAWSAPGGSAVGTTQSLLTTITAKASLGASVGVHLDTFYGDDFGDVGMGPSSLAALGVFFNSTPLTVLRFGDGPDSYDPTTGILYAPGPSGGAYLPTTSPGPNYAWFQSWCYARTPHCQWLVDLPAEENNTAAAVHYANWYHKVLGFAPTYWELGNEPIAWTHYGINMTKWNTKDASTPTGLAYATMVRNYVKAVTAVYPKDQFLGIQSYCACDKVYVPPTAQLDGGVVAGLAFHEYPSLTNSTTSLSQFYGALRSGANVTNSVTHFRSLLTSGCSKCGGLPVVIGEYQAGPAGGISPFSLQYPGAPFMAASIIQALDANVSTFSLFENSWLISNSNGSLEPEGILYQRILDNMTMGTDYAVKVAAGTVGGVWALLVKNGTREAFLLVNTNTTYALKLPLTTTFFPIGGSGEYWSWGPTQSAPAWHRSTALPSTYAVPAQGILLLTNY